jgi:PIN domain nuclease of toxin-antitoxin system
MSALILDACALIAFLADEPGSEYIASTLIDTQLTHYIHVINVCEVYYDMLRRAGREQAEQMLALIAQLGIVKRADLDPDFWKQVAHYKAHLKRISLADCFALSLTLRLEGTLLTSDHHEFDPVAAQGLCPIRFIR